MKIVVVGVSQITLLNILDRHALWKFRNIANDLDQSSLANTQLTGSRSERKSRMHSTISSRLESLNERASGLPQFPILNHLHVKVIASSLRQLDQFVLAGRVLTGLLRRDLVMLELHVRL